MITLGLKEQKKMENNILELLKKYKWKIVLFGILCFGLCLLVVQIPYWIGDIKTMIWTDFSAESVLGFLGDFLSAAGTVILGWVAMKQTDYANKISDRLLMLEERRYNDEHKPAIVLDWVKLHDSSYRKIAMNVAYPGRLYYVDSPNYDPNTKDGFWEMNIINTGTTGIYNCVVEKVSSVPDELKIDCIAGDIWDAPFNLKPGESMELNLYVNPDIIERYAQKKIESITLRLRCINNFGEKYCMTFTVAGRAKEYTDRYEKMLIPTPHSVKWEMECELKEE